MTKYEVTPRLAHPCVSVSQPGEAARLRSTNTMQNRDGQVTSAKSEEVVLGGGLAA
jgi:hypothetical protein